MPQRNRFLTVPGNQQVQGDDSWVKIKFITVGEMEALRAAATEYEAALEDAEDDDTSATDELLHQVHNLFADYILDWNWVDDDGKELPKPAGNPAVFKQLIPPETQFLMTAISTGGDALEKKGKKSKSKR